MGVVVRVDLDRHAGLELPTIAGETTWVWVTSESSRRYIDRQLELELGRLDRIGQGRQIDLFCDLSDPTEGRPGLRRPHSGGGADQAELSPNSP